MPGLVGAGEVAPDAARLPSSPAARASARRPSSPDSPSAGLTLPCQSPWRHTKDVYSYPDDGLGGHNFCRNPGAEESGPWCYTLDFPNTMWELCDVGAPASQCDPDNLSHALPGGAEAPKSARTIGDGVTTLAVRAPVDGHVKELELVFFEAPLAPSMGGIKIVLLPINGDADLFLSFSTPKPDRRTATWVDESVGVKQFTLPASSELYCPGVKDCSLYVGVSGFEEGDFKLFLYNYTQPPTAGGGAPADGGAGASYYYSYDGMFLDYSCAPGCDDMNLGNAVCDLACNVTDCVWDGGDCGYSGGYNFEQNCAAACPVTWIDDGYCDEACFNEACTWDGADCQQDSAGCSNGCMPIWIDDRECDAQCNNEACGWDGHDCDHGNDSCYHDPKGTDYRGPVAQSASGYTCQFWSEQWPNAHTHSVLAFPNAGLGGHNSCRNPNSEEAGPWCYTIGGPRWELCTVPPPSPNCSDGGGLSVFRTQCPVDCGSMLGNGRCDIRCNITSCAYDAGDCGVGLSFDAIMNAAKASGFVFPTSLDSPYAMTMLVRAAKPAKPNPKPEHPLQVAMAMRCGAPTLLHPQFTPQP